MTTPPTLNNDENFYKYWALSLSALNIIYGAVTKSEYAFASALIIPAIILGIIILKELLTKEQTAEGRK